MYTSVSHGITTTNWSGWGTGLYFSTTVYGRAFPITLDHVPFVWSSIIATNAESDGFIISDTATSTSHTGYISIGRGNKPTKTLYFEVAFLVIGRKVVTD